LRPPLGSSDDDCVDFTLLFTLALRELQVLLQRGQRPASEMR